MDLGNRCATLRRRGAGAFGTLAILAIRIIRIAATATPAAARFIAAARS
jgi:hypothetical protein